MNASSRMETEEVLRVKLGVLRREHADLDAAIRALQDGPPGEAFTLQRLKKRKLGLKDEIARIEDRLIPDILA
ncbi:DUF465 domain-containing protein [Mesobaculum littorinae]|uniref:DUF465 domain-containing protein n=1 Tax=Mesobaculum littorinae TaxID=2486419 RepID=A0A438AKN0_9RHOB|nr:DUF465 domain-containing protein [Mesobaculum littorinae]RVV99137.1 DUF465 domain-containing protein [Mesobaculum littorinae]